MDSVIQDLYYFVLKRGEDISMDENKINIRFTWDFADTMWIGTFYIKDGKIKGQNDD